MSSGMLLGQIRHLFSVVSVNPQDDCLLARVRGTGYGTEPAGWAGSSGMPKENMKHRASHGADWVDMELEGGLYQEQDRDVSQEQDRAVSQEQGRAVSQEQDRAVSQEPQGGLWWTKWRNVLRKALDEYPDRGSRSVMS